MESAYHYIRASGVRKLAKEQGKQINSDFLAALDRQVYAMISRACKANGGSKRLNASIIE